jgi:glycosyltransferase involved in cell wall biosynthesis
MNSPKVTIITVAYNSEKTIEDTLKSVANQTYNNVEYIIIDGKSTDDTLEICNNYADKITKIISEKDKGIYDAMNKGIQQATGDIIGILNSDDFYANDQVIEQIVFTFNQQKVDVVYADLVYVDTNDTNKITRTWVSKPYQQNAFLKGWMPPHPTFFIKKECYDKYGTYTLKLKSAADYELMLRMIHKYQIKVGYLPKIITKMRVGGVSNSSIKNRINANREDKIAWKMNGLKPNALTLIRKPLSKITQFLKK